MLLKLVVISIAFLASSNNGEHNGNHYACVYSLFHPFIFVGLFHSFIFVWNDFNIIHVVALFLKNIYLLWNDMHIFLLKSLVNNVKKELAHIHAWRNAISNLFIDRLLYSDFFDVHMSFVFIIRSKLALTLNCHCWKYCRCDLQILPRPLLWSLIFSFARFMNARLIIPIDVS